MRFGRLLLSARWSDLGVRSLSGIVLVVVAIVSARAGGAVFVATWLLASIAVLWEWMHLPGPKNASMLPLAVGTAALVAIGILSQKDLFSATLVLIGAIGAQAGLNGPGRRSWAAGGQLYAGMLVMSVMALRFSFPFGSRAIIWLFAVVWSTDVFAYFGGRLFGGPKIWPRVSPSKTWSGTLIGVSSGALIGTFAAARDLPAPPAAVQIFCLSLVAAILSQAGDAFESGLKRHFGVKDAGKLIPGHGGVMDRLDGFIAAAVFAFLVGFARNLPSVASGLFYWA